MISILAKNWCLNPSVDLKKLKPTNSLSPCQIILLLYFFDHRSTFKSYFIVRMRIKKVLGKTRERLIHSHQRQELSDSDDLMKGLPPSKKRDDEEQEFGFIFSFPFLSLWLDIPCLWIFLIFLLSFSTCFRFITDFDNRLLYLGYGIHPLARLFFSLDSSDHLFCDKTKKILVCSL